MHSVYFKNQKGVIRPIGSGKDSNICLAVIDAFLAEHKYKSYYRRLTNTSVTIKGVESDATEIDVGSHVEFFYVRPPLDISIGENSR